MIPLNRPCIYTSINDFDTKSYFEENFAGYQYKLLFASRDGLNLIYKHLYKRYGSLRVLVSPLSCFIALYPIVQNGHIPVFVDINPYTFNVDEAEVVKRNDVQVIQLIYLGGNPINLDIIIPWAKSNNVIIIEDCAQALGSKYKDNLLGSFGDYSVFSMVKNLHAIAGGLALYKNELDTQHIDVVSNNVMIYKHFKRLLESKVTADKINIFNHLYKSLLILKETGVHGGGESAQRSRTLSINDELAIMNTFHNLSAHINKRLNITKIMIDNICHDKYFIQQEPTNSISNRNRLILLSRNKEAKELIFNLRHEGIAANNLTQSYLNGVQEHISRDKILGKFYCKQLNVYETCFPKIIAIPNSPSLSADEVNYIITKVNEIN